MTLQDLLTQFKNLHLDEREEWGDTSNANMAINAINFAIREVLKKIIADSTIRKNLSSKTEILLNNNIGEFPGDFLQLYKVYDSDGNEIDNELYEIKLEDGIYKIYTKFNDSKIIIEYIKKHPMLSSLDDLLKLPVEFEGDVLNYALVEYFRNQRDWGNVSNALQYAEGKILENIKNYWME